MSAAAAAGLQLPLLKRQGLESPSCTSEQPNTTDAVVYNNGNEADDIYKDTTIAQDLQNAVIASRYLFLTILSLGSLFFYQMSIAPYQIPSDNDNRVVNTLDKLV